MMQIRPAKPSDLPPLAAIAAAAYVDCDIDSFLCPGRKEYPEAYQDYYLFTLRCEIYEHGFLMMVAEEDGSEGLKIAGFACWLRTGEHRDTKIKPDGKTHWSWKEIRKSFAHGLLAQIFFAFRNPATSLRHSFSYMAFGNESYSEDEPEFDDCLFLSQLAVDPEAQRKGIGKRLVQWGLDMAKQENIPAVLYATTQGRPLYDTMGFREVGTWQYSKEKENVMAIMKWDNDEKQEIGQA